MSLPVPDMVQRPRDAFTDALIRGALEEEQQRKKQKKGEHCAGPKPNAASGARSKGQTLRQIEESEGGPVKESYVGIAAVQRALRRKRQAADDDETSLADLEVAEEDEEQQQQHYKGKIKGISAAVAAAMEGDGGYQMTGFNMRQERDEGTIDEEGNFIPAKDDEETGADAWLNSAEATEISEKVREAAAKRQAALQQAEEAPALSETAVAQAQRDIAALLLPGENVTAGLRRLGAARQQAATGKALGKREKQRLAAQQQAAAATNGDAAAAAAAAAVAMTPTEAQAAFTRLTELADLLLNSGGELDVYSHKKEQLERWAAAVLPQTDLLAAGGADDEDDMFADDADKAAAKPTAAAANNEPTSSTTELDQSQQQAASTQVAAAAALGPNAAEAGSSHAPATNGAAQVETDSTSAATEPAVDYASWPVKELRRFLTERGLDSSSIVEKQELVDKVSAVLMCNWQW
eukprot:GHRR01018846.1.p1 GENE.GHRR01018846.1~~GHRR01018846.1.p1  ORF type:complete len:465 (+),score=234.70 GHRR01018846.1:373-1767(+)